MTPSVQYSEYKASGVDWLGDIPAHWDTIKLKNGFDLHKRPAVKSAGIVTAFRDGQVTLRSNRRIDGYTEGDKQIGYQTIHPGDLVIHAMDAFAGAIGVSDSFGQSTPVYSVCTPKSGFNSYFFARALRHIALTGYITSLAKGVRERSTDFRWADAKELPVPRPPIEEQENIVAFLDRETAQIDDLISKQERLVQLLAEKRQAIITHAVTRGLPSAARLKSTGFPWLGDVPAHWRVAALKHVLRIPISDGPHETPEFLDEGVPFVSAEAVSSGVIDFSKIRGFISHADNKRYSRKYSPRRGDIYMIKSGATTGVTALVETDEQFNIWSPLAAIRCDDTVLPEYLLAFLRSAAFLDSVALHWSFGTQQNIGMGVLGDLPVAIPPMDEQRRTVDHLRTKTLQINVLMDKAHAVVSALKERRSALISAAVTGKIDVREGVA